jgi:hypothetical protein
MVNLDNYFKTRAMANRGVPQGGQSSGGGEERSFGGGWYGQPTPVGNANPYAAYGESGGYDPTAPIEFGDEFTFNMPPEWQLAQDVYGQFAQGIPYGMPGAWESMMGPMMNMVRSGRPVDVSAIGEMMKPQMTRQMEEFTAQALERADLGGLAQSSPLGAQLTRESERMAENWGTTMAQMEAGAQESAMQRALSSLGYPLAMGQGQFGMEQAGRQEQLGALQGLIGTGWLPMELSERQMGVGGQMFGAQSQQIQQLMNNPYMMELFRMISDTGFVDPRYEQGPLSTGLGIFGQLAPYANQIFGPGAPPTQPIGDAVGPGPGPGFPY